MPSNSVSKSGTHNWSYTYQDPDGRKPLSVENTVGEISDDPAAWRAMMQTLTRLIPQNAFIVNMLQSQSKRSVRHILSTLPNADDVLTAMSDALAALEVKN